MAQEVRPTIVYFGTPEFAVPPLEALATKFDVILVISAPDRAVGRAQAVTPSAVKQKALAQNIPVLTPETLKDDEIFERLSALKPDFFVVAAYGLILPERILEIPKQGALNIHPSLLPKWRGSSPIEHAILLGDTTTGVTIMQMDAKMDHGPIIVQEECVVDAKETQESLTKKLSQISTRLIVRAVTQWSQGTIKLRTQDHEAATYAKLLARDDGHLVWSRSAKELERQTRAFHHWPGAFTFWQRNDARVRLKIGVAEVVSSAETRPIGQVFSREPHALLIQTGEGALAILQIQPEGKREMTSAEFLNGNPDLLGSILS